MGEFEDPTPPPIDIPVLPRSKGEGGATRFEKGVGNEMDPLQLAVTWYKIRHAGGGEQAVHWDIQNKATLSSQICIFFVLDVPVHSLLSSMVDFVPCDC